jgi:Fe-S-cluster containining protein
MSNPDIFIFPPDVDYECTQCGRCCSHPWEIPLDPDDIERLRSVDWAQSRAEMAGLPLVVPRKSDPQKLTLQRDGTRCVFLLEDNRCLIHRERGLGFKPRACQQFPFVFTETPAGTYVGVSFATSGVRSGQGEPLRRNETWLRQIAAKPYHRRSIRDPVMFHPGVDISFQDAHHLEAGLCDILEPGWFSLEDDLVAGGVYLDLFHEFTRQRAESGGKPGEEFKDGWRRLGYRRIRDIAAKLRASPLAQRMFLTNFIMCVEAAYGDGTSVGQMVRSVVAQAAAGLRLGSVRLRSLGAVLSLRAHSAVLFPSEDREVTDPLRLYLRHVMFRKRLIPYCGVKMGYLLLCIYFALIRWFAQARAAVRRSQSVEPEDIPESIATVERYYVLHTRFDQVFEHPLLQSLLARASAQKSFIASIVRSEHR